MVVEHVTMATTSEFFPNCIKVLLFRDYFYPIFRLYNYNMKSVVEHQLS